MWAWPTWGSWRRQIIDCIFSLRVLDSALACSLCLDILCKSKNLKSFAVLRKLFYEIMRMKSSHLCQVSFRNVMRGELHNTNKPGPLKAMMRTKLSAWINSPSHQFSSERISADRTHPGMPGWDQACESAHQGYSVSSR